MVDKIIPGFLLGVAVPKDRLGEIVEQLFLNGCTIEQLNPMLPRGRQPDAPVDISIRPKLIIAEAKEAGRRVTDKTGKEELALILINRQHPAPTTRRQVTEFFKKHGRNNPDTALMKLRQEGKITNVAPGVYRLPDQVISS